MKKTIREIIRDANLDERYVEELSKIGISNWEELKRTPFVHLKDIASKTASKVNEDDYLKLFMALRVAFDYENKRQINLMLGWMIGLTVAFVVYFFVWKFYL